MTPADIITKTELDYVRTIARVLYRRFHGLIEFEDFLAVGNLALVESAKAFNEERRCSLKTFCDKHVRGAMYRYAQKELDVRRPFRYDDWGFSESEDDEEIPYEETIEGKEPSALATAITKQLADKAQAGIKKLKNKKISQAINLYVLQEMPRREVSKFLGINEVQVWRYISWGIEKARRTLSDGASV